MPAVVVTTSAFLPLVQVEASLRGIGEPRALVVDHPIGGVDEAGVEARADAGAEALRRLLGLTRGGGGRTGGNGSAADPPLAGGEP